MAAIAVCEDCGWRSKRTTPATAAYVGRRHVCDAHRKRVARVGRVEARKAASGPRRNCRHKIARHTHGTKAAYSLDRCRCRPCRDAANAYARQLGRQHAYGRPTYIDATRAREHVRALMAAGMGLKRIVIVSGVPQGTLWNLVYGKRRPDGTQRPSARIRPGTEAALLAVTVSVDTLADGAFIDGTGTARRLQALVTLGWSQSKLARRLDTLPRNLTRLVHGRRGVTVATAKAVSRLYDELWRTPPPEDTHRDRIAAARARNYARAHDWQPPLFWDDIDHDPAPRMLLTENVPASRRGRLVDLTGDVDPVVVERLMRGEPVAAANPAEQFDAYRTLRDRGLPPTRAAEQVGASLVTRKVFADAYTSDHMEATA